MSDTIAPLSRDPAAKPASVVPLCPPESRRYALAAAILASSMGFIDGSVVSLALPAMRADLGASLIDAQWISNSYLLFLSALVLLGGAAGDMFGVRRIFAAGIAIFVVTSLACAIAPNASVLIAVRALQGVGAALMVPGSLSLIAKSFPANERGRAIGQWAAFASLTTALGPFLGGMLLTFGDAWMWRLIFAINLPAGLLALALLFRNVPDDRPTTRRKLDLAGAVLATLGLGALAWGLTQFGVPAAERAVSPSAWLIGSALFLILFVVWEAKSAAPMVKLSLFRSKAFSGANLYTLILYCSFTGVLFFLPMTMISAWGMHEWQAALTLLPLSLLIAGLSGLSGRVADRIGPRAPLTLGALLVAVSFTGVAMTAHLAMLWTVTFPILIVMGLGMAILVSPLSVAVMLAAPEDEKGLASGINNAVARIAGLVAIAALGAVAGLVFAAGFDAQPVGIEFGAKPIAAIAPALDAVRIAATNHAFAVVSALSAAMSYGAAAIAWFTQPSWTGGKPEGA